MFVSTQTAKQIIEGLKKVSKNSNFECEENPRDINLYFSDISEKEMEKFILWLQNSFDLG